MFCFRIPRVIEDGSIRLRPLRIFDGLFLMSGLKDEDILLANGLNKPVDSSWFFVWWWFKKTFVPGYCIEYDSRAIGFIGLYNLLPAKSAEVSLVIFDRGSRRKGYGTRSFKILILNLQRFSLIREITARVMEDNQAAISFYAKLGFKERSNTDCVKTMASDFSSPMHLSLSRLS
ncbi:MAG: GNAT family N-acetyltransferase [Syntrophobacteraceae bacterium]